MKLHPLTWVFGVASLIGLCVNATTLTLGLTGQPTIYVPNPAAITTPAKLLQSVVESMVSLSFLGIAANVEFLSRVLRTLQDIRSDKRFD